MTDTDFDQEPSTFHVSAFVPRRLADAAPAVQALVIEAFLDHQAYMCRHFRAVPVGPWEYRVIQPTTIKQDRRTFRVFEDSGPMPLQDGVLIVGTVSAVPKPEPVLGPIYGGQWS